jgi:hypothetical protein
MKNLCVQNRNKIEIMKQTPYLSHLKPWCPCEQNGQIA